MIYYNLKVRRGNPKLNISDDLAAGIKAAVIDASQSPNSKRKGRYYEYIGRIDDRTLAIRLASEGPIPNPTRTISSITRSLMRNYEGKQELIDTAYCGNILNAELDENSHEMPEIIDRLEDFETVQLVFEIFYGQSKLDIIQKRRAQNAKNQISKIVLDYINGK